ncbi:ComF family protein [Pelistega sp. NLN82]|uniref:ComF family protein n=1 Tax=Pelistega ratti TaxID=2652177 RepID=A0A6L9Y4G2_9BURK|nr:ComF family protein [Pelistega ratti]NEN74867.1 ComF family protein [Pelistega ratti]
MFKNWMNFLSTPCPLCQEPSTKGLFCSVCQHDILYSLNHYPHRCSHCLLPLDKETTCENCREHRLILHRIFIGFDYIPPLNSLLLRFKNSYQPHLSRAFAHLFHQQLKQQNISLSPTDILIPIPSSEQSLQKRGFNPATLFAKDLAKQLGCQLDVSLLYKHPTQHHQKSLDREDRFAKSSHLYYCIKRYPKKHVILIDDILTTGSTLDCAARALIAAGVEKVDAFVIARTAKPLNSYTGTT